MTVEKISEDNVSYYVEEINELIEKIKRTSKILFEVFQSAYKKLTTDEFENEFIRKINMDPSTINKMKKICKSDFIMGNRDKLPNSWATLYQLVNVDESEIQKLIDIGEITTNTTKKKTIELINKINSTIHEYEDEYDNFIGESENDEFDDVTDNKSVNKIYSPIYEIEYDNLVSESANYDGEYDDNDNSVNNRDKHWVGMPEFNNSGDDDGSYKKLVIRFKNEEDFLDFTSNVSNLKLTNNS